MENKDGVVYIENGKLTIIDPQGLGRYPRITASENVDIYIDGKKENKEIVVSKDVEDLIELKINSVDKKKDLNIKVTKDKLKAYLVIDIVPEQLMELKDTEAENHIIIETESKEKSYPEINKNEIIELLNKRNISYGVKHKYINEIINTKGDISGKYLIAEGKEAKVGSNAKIIKNDKYKNLKDNMFNVIDSIDKGEIICYKKEAKPGKSGINIFSEKIPSPSVKDIKLQGGKNVKLTEDGLKAIALIGGQPKIIRRRYTAKVKINKQYIIHGDVDKHTGNIKYDGDLLVKGDITDYFNVDVGNDLKVNGNIANSEVKNQGNLYVKNNIIASKLYIGNYLEKDTVNKLKKIIDYIDKLKKAVEEILGEASKRQMNVNNFRTGRVIRLLIENKFKQLKPLILNTYKSNDDKDKLNKYFKEIIPYFKNTTNLETESDETIIYEFGDDLREFLDTQLDNNGLLNIYAGYIQNSEIKIGGSVIIDRLGFYNSTINAKGSIIANSKSGFIKGGDYEAEEIIYAQEAGSHLGKTHFKIGDQIFIKKALGTLIINTYKDRKIVDEGTKNINYKVDDFGKLVQATKLPNINKYLLKFDKF